MFRSFQILMKCSNTSLSKDVLELLSLKVMFLGPSLQGKSITHCRVMKDIIDLLSAEREEQTWQHRNSGVLFQYTSPRST